MRAYSCRVLPKLRCDRPCLLHLHYTVLSQYQISLASRCDIIRPPPAFSFQVEPYLVARPQFCFGRSLPSCVICAHVALAMRRAARFFPSDGIVDLAMRRDARFFRNDGMGSRVSVALRYSMSSPFAVLSVFSPAQVIHIEYLCLLTFLC